MMASAAKTDHTAVVATAESGASCTVTVQREPLGTHLLRYEGTESVVAVLTPEVIESLSVALSLRARSAVTTRCAVGGACTLLVMGRRDGGSTLYFHAVPATSAVLDAAAVTTLRAALESLHHRPDGTAQPATPAPGTGQSPGSRQNGDTGPTPAPSG